MPSSEFRLDVNGKSVRQPSEVTRTLAKQLIIHSQGDEIDERISGVLEDVPEGILRAFVRHGITICVRDDKTDVYYDVKSRCVNVLREHLSGEPPPLCIWLGAGLIAPVNVITRSGLIRCRAIVSLC